MLTPDEAHLATESLFASVLRVNPALVSLGTMGLSVGPVEDAEVERIAAFGGVSVEHERSMAPIPGLSGLAFGTVATATLRVGDPEDPMLIHVRGALVPDVRTASPDPDRVACLAAQRCGL